MIKKLGKKTTLALGFLVSVIVDVTALNNLLYGENILQSNLLYGIILTIAVISVKDVQGMIDTIIKGKFGK